MGLQYLKCFHVEAGKISPEEFYDHAVVYKPNVIFGEPSWLLRLSELANDRGTWPMKLLFGGGENITEEARQVVERVWGAPLYLSYGQTESFGTLGAECERPGGLIYHRPPVEFTAVFVKSAEYAIRYPSLSLSDGTGFSDSCSTGRWKL